MRASLGAHRDGVHAGEVEQPPGQLIDHLQRALDRFLRLERVDVGKAGQPRDLLVQARVVLHGAGAERKQTEVDRVILARKARVVANRFGLRQPRKPDRSRSLETAEATSPLPSAGEGLGRGDAPLPLRFAPPPSPARGEGVKIDAGLFGRSNLEDQRLLEHQRTIAGDCLFLAMLHWRAPTAASPKG